MGCVWGGLKSGPGVGLGTLGGTGAALGSVSGRSGMAESKIKKSLGSVGGGSEVRSI